MGEVFSGLPGDNFGARYDELTSKQKAIFTEQYKFVREYFDQLDSEEMYDHSRGNMPEVMYMRSFLEKNYDHLVFKNGPPKHACFNEEYKAQSLLREFAWRRLLYIDPKVTYFFYRYVIITGKEDIMRSTCYEYRRCGRYVEAILRYNFE